MRESKNLYWSDYLDSGAWMSGSAHGINDYVRTPTQRREFPIGFHPAPGPSWPEPKPVFRVKARSQKREESK